MANFEKPPYQAIVEMPFIFKEWLRKLWERVFNLGNPITSSLGADVALNNTANYFTGPSVSQGTVGVWFASGSVVVSDTGGAAVFDLKLWDGTTIIDSARQVTDSVNANAVSLSGYIINPTGNIKISVKDSTAATGKIRFNASGNSMDGTLTVIRIA